MSATDALSAILHQLFTYNPASGLIGHALPSHRNYGKNLTQNFSELWRILVDCANSPGAGDIVCVIDALDECNADNRRQLIDKLKELYCQPRPSNQSSKLKFLITSRPYDDLEVSFKRFSDTTAYLYFDGDEKSAQISEEINLVIDARLDIFARDFEDDDRRAILERLKSMENRTYLWVHLTFDILEQDPSKYGKRSDVETLLSDIPSKVSEAYEKILDRSKTQDQTETLLQIVLAAAEPLTLDEANIALTLALQKQRLTSHTNLESQLWSKRSFEGTVKNLCGLFISVYDSKLSFIHQTAKEFLVHPGREGKWKGRFSMSEAHGTMTLACLSYLSCLDEQRPIEEIRKCPLALYSAQCWMNHAKPAETEKYVQENILNFFLQQRQAYAVWNVLFEPDRPFFELSRHRNMATPLYYASFVGLQHTVELLLEKGVNVNAQGGYYGNALQAASDRGHKDIVQLLLGAGADVCAQGREHSNALQAASSRGYTEIVQLLLEEGANVNSQGRYFGYSLQAASYQGYKDIVQLLLEEGADVNAQSQRYGNALQAASINGHKEIVQLLLGEGANVNTQGGSYGNALQAASFKGHKKIVQLLLKEEADVNAQGGCHDNALQAASWRGDIEVVQLLLEEGADVNAQGGMYSNALQAASTGDNKEVVQLLLEEGADVNAPGGAYDNALQAAFAKGHEEVVQLLLQNGAVNTLDDGDPNTVSSD